MLIGALTACWWVVGFLMLLTVPVQRKWRDSGDCTGLVLHTVRAPSELERWSMWWDKYYPVAEDINPLVYSGFGRIILPKSKFLVGTSYDITK